MSERSDRDCSFPLNRGLKIVQVMRERLFRALGFFPAMSVPADISVWPFEVAIQCYEIEDG